MIRSYDARLMAEAMRLGWWAVEDPTHHRGWRTVRPGTPDAEPDIHRLERQRRAWCRRQLRLAEVQQRQREQFEAQQRREYEEFEARLLAAFAEVPPAEVEIVETTTGTEHRFKAGGMLFIPHGLVVPGAAPVAGPGT